MSNLIISPTGENSLFENWEKNQNFDLIFLYYSNSDEKFNELKSKHEYVYKMEGEKWKMVKDFITSNLDFIQKYETIWFPDDDISIEQSSLEKLFKIHKDYGLELSQPSVIGYTSHKITNPQKDTILRYTNFVEIMCPMMGISTLNKLLDTFDYTVSGYGLDLLWPKLLDYPKDKIAIIDEVTVKHVNPVGGNYLGRFKIAPIDELYFILNKYDITFDLREYNKINKMMIKIN